MLIFLMFYTAKRAWGQCVQDIKNTNKCQQVNFMLT